MENKQEQTQSTQVEMKKGLSKAIEMQKLQTELQELRTRLVVARANEIFNIMKINEMTSEPKQETKPTDIQKEFEEAIKTEKKLKVEKV